jgi:hypothetical protein
MAAAPTVAGDRVRCKIGRRTKAFPETMPKARATIRARFFLAARGSAVEMVMCFIRCRG